MDPVLVLEDVEKTYRLGAERMNWRQALPGRLGRTPPQGHRALDGVSLEVAGGESVGIIGENGAGKSTLLKLVARVIAPTRGFVYTRGRVASLIELGVGFHPDLTGAHNVRFAGAILGMGSSEVRRRYDEIVAFAGMEKFMATPVKRYSSGMLARLGFAVASHVDADILVLDEVLSVGDAAFQRQCHDRITELRRSGVSVLFVSHNLGLVPKLCERLVRLQGGRIVDEGAPSAVIDRYEAAVLQGREDHPAPARRP